MVISLTYAFFTRCYQYFENQFYEKKHKEKADEDAPGCGCCTQACRVETKRFSLETTLHGFGRIYNTHGCMRVFWAVATISFLCVCVQQVVLLLQTYLSGPVNTITFISRAKGEERLPFPAVTICNANPISRTYIEAQNMTALTQAYLSLFAAPVASKSTFMEAMSTIGELEFRRYLRSIDVDPEKFSLYELYNDAGQTCEQLILHARFQGVALDDICNSGKVQTVVTSGGKCFTISDLGYQIHTGANMGLVMHLNVSVDDYPDEYHLQIPGAPPPEPREAGVRIQVHSAHETPIPLSSGIVAPIGSRSYVGIRQTLDMVLANQVLYLNSSSLINNQGGYNTINVQQSTDHATWLPSKQDNKSPRQMNSSVLITGVTAPTDFDLTHFDSYTQSNCQMDCYMNQMLDDCGCISGILGLSSGYRTCTPKMLYDCYGQISEDDIAGLIEDSYRECECRSLCKVVDYKTVISTVPFARTTKKALAQNRTTEQDDLSIVDIAFLEQGYIKIMQEKGTTFTQTLSDIGGQLGLFLGASCMSLFEFVEFFARLLYAHGYGPKRSIARKE